MTEDYKTVEASYDRCLENGEFFDTFYDTFFAKSEEIPPLFANTDFLKQKQVVRLSVRMLIRIGLGEEGTMVAINKLGETHSRKQHNIRPELYELWLDALCESVAKHDPEYSPELEQKWRDTMHAGIELITSKY